MVLTVAVSPAYNRAMSTTQITRTEQTIDGLDAIVWTITEDGEQIGHLDAHTSGLILNVEVIAARQGEGFARKLYEHADAEHGLLHVPAWGRTWEGEQGSPPRGRGRRRVHGADGVRCGLTPARAGTA